MKKNTILAVILSILVIFISMFVQMYFFPPEIPNQVQKPQKEESVLKEVAQPLQVINTLSYQAVDNAERKQFLYETKDLQITFDTKGASISSYKLKHHKYKNGLVELIFTNNNEDNPFIIYVGDDRSIKLDQNFNYEIKDNKVIFTQNFYRVINNEVEKDPFTIIKTYTFAKEGYLFEIKVDMKNSLNKVIPLYKDNSAYTIGFTPQLGPAFDKMPGGTYFYRNMYVKADSSKKKESIKFKDGKYNTDKFLSWAALTGKYFSVIAIPDSTKYSWTLNQIQNEKNQELLQKDEIMITRPIIKTSNISDTFKFYIGPQLKETMTPYNKAENNEFNLSNLELEKALDSSFWLGWLEYILKFLLQMFYKVIPNYGVAIILLTILTRVLLYPLTKKSLQSQAKMSELTPQRKKIQEKYKDNPTKMNIEINNMYKENGVNQLGGCLPMLIQFPIFIALYGLLNKHFDLRGAMFIPGWINDLSQPDTLFNLPFALPFIGNNFNLLPIIYTATMILSSKLTTSSSADMGGVGKFMIIGMPLIFFFVLYNSPSGLLLYWSATNIVSIIQHFWVARKKKNETSIFKRGKK